MTDTELLATGIHNAAVRLGMIEQGTELTGPQCLMLLGNIEDMAAKAQTERKAVAWRLKTGHGIGWRDVPPDGELAHLWTPLYE